MREGNNITAAAETGQAANRFNLCFKGEIHPGKDPEHAMLKVAELLGVTDQEQLDRYLSGASVVLLEDLDRKSAAEYYSQLNKVGAAVKLVKITASAPAESGEPASETGSPHSAQSGNLSRQPVVEAAPGEPAARDREGQQAERAALEQRTSEELRKE